MREGIASLVRWYTLKESIASLERWYTLRDNLIIR